MRKIEIVLTVEQIAEVSASSQTRTKESSPPWCCRTVIWKLLLKS